MTQRVETEAQDEEAPTRGASSAPGLAERVRGLFTVEPGADGVEAAPEVALREILRRFWPDLRPLRARLALGLLLLALVPAVDAAQIWLFKLVVDEVLVPGELAPLVWLAGAYVGLALLGGALSFADEVLATSVGERFLLAVRRRVYRHLHAQSLDVLDRRRLGDLLSRLTADVQAIESFVVGGLGETFAAVVRIAIFTGILLYLQWDLALVSLLGAPLFWLAAKRFGRLIRAASREKRRRTGSLASVAEEGIANAALVQAYGRRDDEVERFEREARAVVGAEMAATRLRALFTPLVDLLELAGGLVVLTWGAWAVSEGRLTLGGLLAFLTYLALLYSPVRDLGHLGTSVFAAAAAAERVLELLDHRPLVTDAPDARPLRRARGLVELDRVTFTYPGAERPAVRDVSLRLEPGRVVALAGASGAGKTTLAKLLLRWYDPDGGAVRLDGHDLRGLRVEDVRANVALLLQETLVFDGTIRENVAYGDPHATEAQLDAALRAAGLDTVVAALPEGLETRVGQRGRRLSGGQRQRVALARALLRDAPVLVLDEPSAGLDEASVRRLLAELRPVFDARATLLITHDPLVLAAADEVVVLERGRLVPAPTAAAA